MRVVAVAGAKGGVGKTAAAVNLSMISARDGFRTLLWDLDPQGAATHCYRARARVKGGASRLLGGKRDPRGVRQAHRLREPRPASSCTRRSVSSTRSSAPGAGPSAVSAQTAAALEGKYDVVILDCAPGLGVVTESVVMASDLVLAPIIPAPLAVRSLDQLQEFVTTSPDRDSRCSPSCRCSTSARCSTARCSTRSGPTVGSLLPRSPLSSSVERMGMEQIPAVLASPTQPVRGRLPAPLGRGRGPASISSVPARTLEANGS